MFPLIVSAAALLIDEQPIGPGQAKAAIADKASTGSAASNGAQAGAQEEGLALLPQRAAQQVCAICVPASLCWPAAAFGPVRDPRCRCAQLCLRAVSPVYSHTLLPACLPQSALPQPHAPPQACLHAYGLACRPACRGPTQKRKKKSICNVG